MKPLIILTAIVIFIASCAPSDNQISCPGQTITCQKLGTYIWLDGYSKEETDTVVITSYEKDGKLQTIKDSIVYSSGVDSIELSSYYDYRIYVEGANRYHTITGIVQPEDSSFIYRGCAGGGKTVRFPTTCSYAALTAIVDEKPASPEKHGGLRSFKLVK